MFSAISTELTNLIIIRNGSSVEAQGSPTPERSKFSHIQFHMIKYEDLKWVSVGLFNLTTITATILWQMLALRPLLWYCSQANVKDTLRIECCIWWRKLSFSMCFFSFRVKALDRDPSLGSLKATKRTFVMGRNTWRMFSWKSSMLFTKTAGRWVSSD